jgi:hypothetical protein
MHSSQVCKGLEGYLNSGLVSKFVEITQDSRDYMGCEDGVRCGVEGKDAFAVVIRTKDACGGSEMLDIPPLAVLGDQIGITLCLQNGW